MKRAAKRWIVGILGVCFLVATTYPVSAAGPFDGIWFVLQQCPSAGFVRTFAVSVTENDATGQYFGATFNMVLFVIDLTTGTWVVDLGTRIGSTVQGQAFDHFGTAFGTFTATATSPTTLSGSALINGVSCSLIGSLVF